MCDLNCIFFRETCRHNQQKIFQWQVFLAMWHTRVQTLSSWFMRILLFWNRWSTCTHNRQGTLEAMKCVEARTDHVFTAFCKIKRNKPLTSVKHLYEAEVSFDFCIHRLVLLLVVLDFVVEIDGRFFGAHLTVVLTELQYLLPYRGRN